jgi:hypothetical protein
MLGLSSGLTSVSAPSSRVLIETYTADWSSGVDGWANWVSNDVAVTLTRVASFEGKSDVLQVEFNADETGHCGFIKPNHFSADVEPGDYIEVTCNIYLDSEYDSTGDGSDDITDRWDGTDTVSTAIQMPGSTTDFWNVAQNQWVALDSPSEDADGDLAISSGDSTLIYWSSVGDRPKDGARVYIHNFVAKLYRSQLFT